MTVLGDHAPFDSADIEAMQRALYEWTRIRDAWMTPPSFNGTPDITKSCLFAWLLEGNDPLDYPPPVMHAAPRHQIIVDGGTALWGPGEGAVYASSSVRITADALWTDGWAWPVLDVTAAGGYRTVDVARLSYMPTVRAEQEGLPGPAYVRDGAGPGRSWFSVPEERWRFRHLPPDERRTVGARTRTDPATGRDDGGFYDLPYNWQLTRVA